MSNKTNEQIGFLDIEVFLKFKFPSERMVLLRRRWDLTDSPFWKIEIKPRPSTNRNVFPYYPHTGDSSRVIWVPKIGMFIEFSSARTSLSSSMIHIEATQGIDFFNKSERRVNPDFSQEELVKVLLDDGWSKY